MLPIFQTMIVQLDGILGNVYVDGPDNQLFVTLSWGDRIRCDYVWGSYWQWDWVLNPVNAWYHLLVPKDVYWMSLAREYEPDSRPLLNRQLHKCVNGKIMNYELDYVLVFENYDQAVMFKLCW